MKIHCANCGIDLGEITAAKLRKGIVYYCKRCGAAVKIKKTDKKDSEVVDFLMGALGMKK